MKSIRFLAIALLATFALAGCDKDNEGLDPNGGKTPTGNRGDIVFNIGIAPGGAATLYNAKGEAQMQTKAVTGSDFRTEFEDGDEVGIFAVRRGSGETKALATSGNYIHNVKLTYNATAQTWTAASDLWHTTGDNVLDFYAYYPYNDNGGSPLTLNPANITFNVLADQSTAANYGKSDLLSGSHTGVAKGTAVNLTFAHKLALVQVLVENTYVDPNTPLTLTLRGCVAGGAFNLGTGDLTIDGGAQSQAVKMFRVEKSTDADYTTKYTYRALVPAQTVASGTNLCLMAQNGQLYNTPTLASALTLSAGDAKLYTAAMPITNIAVPIKAGTFLMGSSDGSNTTTGIPGVDLNATLAEPNRGSNETQHQVTLTKDFYMSKYAVTFAQYDAFCAATSRSKPSDNGWGSGVRPVINVNWNDAVAYCTWLSSQTGQTWRLPTEAEWEYACRAGTTTPFSLGTAGDGTKLVFGMANYYVQYSYDLAKNGYYDVGNNDGYLGKTSPVGSYAPNAWGLYDMHGNVWEWCSDWYAANFGSTNAADAATDPTGASTGTFRVLRGGSWYYYAQNCRSAYRLSDDPDGAYSNFGFRVVLVP